MVEAQKGVAADGRRRCRSRRLLLLEWREDGRAVVVRQGRVCSMSAEEVARYQPAVGRTEDKRRNSRVEQINRKIDAELQFFYASLTSAGENNGAGDIEPGDRVA